MIALLIGGTVVLCIGLLTVVFGIPIKEFSLGSTMILAGAVVSCTGLLLAGMYAVSREIRSLARRLESGLLAPAPAVLPREAVAETEAAPASVRPPRMEPEPSPAPRPLPPRPPREDTLFTRDQPSDGPRDEDDFGTHPGIGIVPVLRGYFGQRSRLAHTGRADQHQDHGFSGRDGQVKRRRDGDFGNEIGLQRGPNVILCDRAFGELRGNGEREMFVDVLFQQVVVEFAGVCGNRRQIARRNRRSEGLQQAGQFDQAVLEIGQTFLQFGIRDGGRRILHRRPRIEKRIFGVGVFLNDLAGKRQKRTLDFGDMIGQERILVLFPSDRRRRIDPG